MATQIEVIKRKMKELETLIKETKERLPAHSTKPPVMMELLDLEDKYDVLLRKFNELKNSSIR